MPECSAEDRPLQLKASSNELLALGLQDIPWDLEQVCRPALCLAHICLSPLQNV